MQADVRDLSDGRDVQDPSDVTQPRDLVQQPASYTEEEGLLNRYLEEQFSHAAFEAIYRRFEPELLALVTDRLRAGPATVFLNDVEDIVERAFTKFYCNREQIDPNKPLQPFLTCIVDSVLTDYLREQTAEKRDYRLTRSLNQAGAGASDGDDYQLGMGYVDPKSRWTAAAQDAKQLLAELMEALPPNEETALRLVWLENYTEEEAAQKMNAPVSSVKWWIRSAKERLRKLAGASPSRKRETEAADVQERTTSTRTRNVRQRFRGLAITILILLAALGSVADACNLDRYSGTCTAEDDEDEVCREDSGHHQADKQRRKSLMRLPLRPAAAKCRLGLDNEQSSIHKEEAPTVSPAPSLEPTCLERGEDVGVLRLKASQAATNRSPVPRALQAA